MEKIRLQTSIFLEILKAVCLSFDWVPKLIQRSFQNREQKFVQRCETKVGADACKASYLIVYPEAGPNIDSISFKPSIAFNA